MLSPHERLNSRLFFLFFTFVLVNLLDLSTTIVAVNMGFREANYALVALSNFAGTGIVTTILLLKIIFIIGV